MLSLISKEVKDRYNKLINKLGLIDTRNRNKLAAIYIVSSKDTLWENRNNIFLNEDKVDSILKSIEISDAYLLELVMFFGEKYKSNEIDILDMLKNMNKSDRKILLNAIEMVWRQYIEYKDKTILKDNRQKTLKNIINGANLKKEYIIIKYILKIQI